MFKKYTYVRPVTNISTAFGWQVVEMTMPEAFVGDIRSYGLRVALYNVWFHFFGKNELVDAEEVFEELGL